MNMCRKLQSQGPYIVAVGFLAGGIILSGCVPENILPPSPSATSTIGAQGTPSSFELDWEKKWLLGNPCLPPCWEGIVPGKTSLIEAKIILQNLEYVSPTSIADSISIANTQVGSLEWAWINSDEGSGGGAVFEASSDGEVIVQIGLVFPKLLLVQEVVDAFGNPSHVYAAADYGPEPQQGDIPFRSMSLLFSDKSMLLTTRDDDIGPRLKVIAVHFMSDAMPTGISNPGWLVEWQGYQSFEFYCRDEYEGRACRGEPYK